ncbi:deoxyguanosinetriphosphate triphosphohydrolase [Actinomyces vulturis]|uniref:deoxyguanosinetriphosphate triphosphohydrolase n=1 Tax=Actinomyces vulturis TaxID=1857645 RepID=UPI00082E61C3|nr:deoxyguanosinetriphosphate triphosphohydrolase [Actinomyces vulturis]
MGAQTYGYNQESTERWVPETGKNPQRTPFERDRARVLHSSALRRLGAKTQVLGPASDDFVRTRLTHSLEVAQVGRALASALGCDPDVVDAACLSHDLGHPPYGHNGENALNTVAASIGGFEGNAQTFRILTRLEPKTLDSQGDCVGLNLTRACLDAVAKYPWQQATDPQSPHHRKFGCYTDDEPIFSWMRQGKPADLPASARCLEADIMDVSDDVGYSVHDVEDAIALGRMNPIAADDDKERDALLDEVIAWYKPSVSRDELGQAWERLRTSTMWLTSYDGSRASQAALKTFTSDLIGRFVKAVAQSTRAVAGNEPLGRYNASLVISRETAAEILLLKGCAVRYVMAPREHEPVYLRQRTVIFDLADALMEQGPAALDAAFAEDWQRCSTDDEKLRVVVDQIASLTDTSARQWHARLCGMFSEL